MKAILIDPEAKLIHDIEFDGDYREISRTIGCDLFTVVQLDRVNCVYVDDEGLLNSPRYFFIHEDYPQPLAGKGLVLGVDDEGETIGTTLEVADLAKKVKFTELSVLGFEESEGVTERYGQEMNFIRSVPVFGPPEEKE